MDIILKENVEKLGRKGDLVKVADGFARNYLLPRRLAILATAANRLNIEQMRAAAERKDAKDLASAQSLAAQLNAVALRFLRRAGDQDTLFGSVTSMDIGAALAEKGFEIDRRRIEMKEPLKTLGEFKVPVHLFHGVTAEVAVSVEREAPEGGGE